MELLTLCKAAELGGFAMTAIITYGRRHNTRIYIHRRPTSPGAVTAGLGVLPANSVVSANKIGWKFV